jgi:CRP-like cAMP-binding protein/predicted MFS family arabinose efflux permease
MAVGRVLEPARAVREALANPHLRRVVLALGAYLTGEWAYQVALAVYAYDVGGVSAVGILWFVQMIPAAAAVPFSALIADRFRRERVLLVIDLAKAGVVAAIAAVALADAPEELVYALAALAAVASAAFRPTQWALLPTLARTPRELVAANVSSSTIEGLAVFAAPAAAGVLLAVGSTSAVFAATAGAFLLAAVLVAGAKTDVRPRRESEKPLAQILAGFRTLRAEPHPRLMIQLFSSQTLVRGALNVLVVVLAIEVLELGEQGVGFLNSAYGIGGLLGALAALSLVGRPQLGHPVAVGLILWGLPIALVGLWPEAAVGLFALAIVGAGNSVLDVSGFTLVQRLVDDRVLSRVFGVLEMVIFLTVGFGALLTPVLVSGLGARGALVVTGAVLPVLALLAWRRLGALDKAVAVPVRQLELVAGMRLFHPLPAPQIERLARRLEPVQAAAGETIVRKGEPGDRFYIVASGEVEVSTNGTVVATLGAGDHFGEIALLHDVPRTATVRALTETELYALGREDLVEALSGNLRSAETASALIEERLERSRALERRVEETEPPGEILLDR